LPESARDNWLHSFIYFDPVGHHSFSDADFIINHFFVTITHLHFLVFSLSLPFDFVDLDPDSFSYALGLFGGDARCTYTF